MSPPREARRSLRRRTRSFAVAKLERASPKAELQTPNPTLSPRSASARSSRPSGPAPAPSAPLALIIEPNAVACRWLTKVARRAGFRAQQLEPQQLDGWRDHVDVVIASDQLPDATLERAYTLAAKTFDAHLILAAHRDGSVWADVFDTHVAVPGELRLLEQLLAQLTPAPPGAEVVEPPAPTPTLRPTPAAITTAPPVTLSQVVTLGSELQLAAQRGDAAVMESILGAIARHAENAGQEDIRSVANMYRQLLAIDAADDLHAIADEVTRLISQVFLAPSLG